MQNLVYLLLRRMRAPLIVVILAYAVTILGLVLIPGVDDQGNPWRMSFFHAFYFVSFMGSTIGFGEIPYAFTDAQRLWTTLCIYLTVISWLYAIGALFSLFGDATFRRIVDYTTFTRAVKRIREPFYLICGLGDAGHLLVRELSEHGIRCVVIDQDERKINALRLEDLPVHVPGLCASSSDSATLLAAGLKNRYCTGVTALTSNDHVNLTIAISCKLLAPELMVICRAESHDSAANMASFGTDHIVNPYDIFAERFAMMFLAPSMHLVYEWMTALGQVSLSEFNAPPRGTWVLCGYGRFGKAVQKSLSYAGIRTVIVESDIEGTDSPDTVIKGRGTEAITLHEAGIQQAVGVLAGTDNDANNLSIIMTALDMNENLFTVARQNLRTNDAIFTAAHTDITMQPDTLIGQRVVDLLMRPLLSSFLRLAREQNEDWANLLVSRVVGVLAERAPETWSLKVSRVRTPAIVEQLHKGGSFSVGQLIMDPRNTTARLPCVPLYLLRANNEEILLPAEDTLLQVGDQLLFCGQAQAQTRMCWTARDFNTLNYLCTGRDLPGGTIWRWLAARPH
ncbi:MAG: NAD-binding protein [Gammaproteobacteria bacterium]